MFKYIDNNQLKEEFEQAVTECDAAMLDKCKINEQQVNNDEVAFSDVLKWCDAVNFDFIVDIQSR